MKRFLLTIIFLLSVSLSYAGVNYNTLPTRIVLDPANSFLGLPIPLPNDINSAILNEDGSAIQLPITGSEPADVQMLYQAINLLKIKGLPANTFLTIPLNNDTKLDISSLYQNIFLIPFMVNVSTSPSINPAPSIVAGPNNLIITQDGNIIKVIAKKPLLSDAQYAVLITKGVKTVSGELVGHDPAMEFLIRTQYNLLIDRLGLHCDDLLGMFTFTTADKTLKLSAFAKLKAGIPLSSTDFLPYSNITEEFQSILAATKLLPSTVDSNKAVNYGSFNYLETSFTTYDITSLTTTPTPEKVPTIILPNGVTDKVIIFQHGFGRSKTDALALAKKFLPAGYPIISMDLPLHGERVDYNNTALDCNHDGKVESGECFLTPNLVEDRINIYQAVFDLTLLLKDLEAGKFDLNGDNVPDKVSKVYFLSLSLGSITGSIFASYNIKDLTKVALTVGGADLAVILDGTTIGDLQKSLEALGLKKGTAEYYVFLGILHLILDPADPLYNVTSALKDKTMVISAYGDNIVPNTSNAIFANIIGYPTATDVTYTNIDSVSSDAGWYQYGGVVDGIPYYVPHAFLLSTENASEKYGISFDQEFIDKARDTMEDQIINFFNK